MLYLTITWIHLKVVPGPIFGSNNTWSTPYISQVPAKAGRTLRVTTIQFGTSAQTAGTSQAPRAWCYSPGHERQAWNRLIRIIRGF